MLGRPLNKEVLPKLRTAAVLQTPDGGDQSLLPKLQTEAVLQAPDGGDHSCLALFISREPAALLARTAVLLLSPNFWFRYVEVFVAAKQ